MDSRLSSIVRFLLSRARSLGGDPASSPRRAGTLSGAEGPNVSSTLVSCARWAWGNSITTGEARNCLTVGRVEEGFAVPSSTAENVLTFDDGSAPVGEVEVVGEADFVGEAELGR